MRALFQSSYVLSDVNSCVCAIFSVQSSIYCILRGGDISPKWLSGVNYFEGQKVRAGLQQCDRREPDDSYSFA